MLICAAVHNDFHNTHSIFQLFDGLSVKDLKKPVEVNRVTDVDQQANGLESEPIGLETNGQISAMAV